MVFQWTEPVRSSATLNIKQLGCCSSSSVDVLSNHMHLDEGGSSVQRLEIMPRNISTKRGEFSQAFVDLLFRFLYLVWLLNWQWNKMICQQNKTLSSVRWRRRRRSQVKVLYFNNSKQISNEKQIQGRQTGRSQAMYKRTYLGINTETLSTESKGLL